MLLEKINSENEPVTFFFSRVTQKREILLNALYFDFWKYIFFEDNVNFNVFI